MGDEVLVIDGFPVDSHGVEIHKLSGGLQEAVEVHDVQFRRGQPMFVLLKIAPDKYKFNPTFVEDVKGKPTDVQKGWQQVAWADLLGVAFVAEEIARDALAESARLIDEKRRADEEARGIARIEFDQAAANGEAATMADSLPAVVESIADRRRKAAADQAE